MIKKQISTSKLQRDVQKLLKADVSTPLQEITSRLFPTATRDAKSFAAKSRLVKKIIPPRLHHLNWRVSSLWVDGVGPYPDLYDKLSISGKDGRKVIGGRTAPCRCAIRSDGTMEVTAYKKHWRGWLIQQLVNAGWWIEEAQEHVINLRCRKRTSEFNAQLVELLRTLKEFTVRDPDTRTDIEVKPRGLTLRLHPAVVESLQHGWDGEDEDLKKASVSESTPLILASVSALHLARLFQGLGLNPQQIRQASDTLAAAAIEDQQPAFVYLVYGPRRKRMRQVGVRALLTPYANYEVWIRPR